MSFPENGKILQTGILNKVSFIGEEMYRNTGRDTGAFKSSVSDRLLTYRVSAKPEVELTWKLDHEGNPIQWKLESSAYKSSGKWVKFPKKNLELHAIQCALQGMETTRFKSVGVVGSKWRTILGVWLLASLALAVKIMSVAIGPLPDEFGTKEFVIRLNKGLIVAADLVSSFTINDFFKVAIGSLLRQPDILFILLICACACVYGLFVPRVVLSKDVFEWRIILPVFVGAILSVILIAKLRAPFDIICGALLVLLVASAVYRSSVHWLVNHATQTVRRLSWRSMHWKVPLPTSQPFRLKFQGIDDFHGGALSTQKTLECALAKMEADRDTVV